MLDEKGDRRLEEVHHVADDGVGELQLEVDRRITAARLTGLVFS